MLNRPDVIEGVHASMLEAGAEVLETDTFQGSRLKLEEWGLADYTLEINTKAAEIARKAAGEDRFVAGSIGPTGFLPACEDPTLGQIRFRELVEVFAEQAGGLIDGGADLIIIETAQDILEVKAAVFGAREAFKSTWPHAADPYLRLAAAQRRQDAAGHRHLSAVLCTLEALKVDVIGLNCSTGPEDMRDAIRFLGEYCPLPVACIPNAGLPLQGPDGETIFPEQPEPLARGAEGVRGALRRGRGRRLLRHDPGAHPRDRGTCGQAPRERTPRPASAPSLLDDRRNHAACRSQGPTMVGERVNSQGSRKAKELLLADDYDGLVQIAEDQVTGGAHVLDLCVALTERQDEDEQMRQVAKKVSLTQPAPIQIDSTEPEVIETRARSDPRQSDRQLASTWRPAGTSSTASYRWRSPTAQP